MEYLIEIRPLDPGASQLDDLAIEARKSGYTFVDRLIQEARTGHNGFDRKGECFCGIYRDGALVGFGGVNQDPYADQHVGRLRHIYILASARRSGLARLLVRELLNRGKTAFSTFRLRTADRGADEFYEAIGFVRTDEDDATHVMRIARNPWVPG